MLRLVSRQLDIRHCFKFAERVHDRFPLRRVNRLLFLCRGHFLFGRGTSPDHEIKPLTARPGIASATLNSQPDFASPEQARDYVRRIEFVYTQKHGRLAERGGMRVELPDPTMPGGPTDR